MKRVTDLDILDLEEALSRVEDLINYFAETPEEKRQAQADYKDIKRQIREAKRSQKL
jgi:hypothetical protein